MDEVKNSECEHSVEYPLDVIQFISGNKKLYNFMEYLFGVACRENSQNKIDYGDDYFPVASYSEKAYAYEFEYDFFVKTYVDYAKEYFDIDDSSANLMYHFLYKTTDKKVTRSRYIFFVVILGNYFSFGGTFYRDLCKNKGMIFFEKLVKNESGKIARSRVIQVRDFIEEHLSNEKCFSSIKREKISQVAYGKKAMESYTKEHDLGDIPKIYDFSKELINI